LLKVTLKCLLLLRLQHIIQQVKVEHSEAQQVQTQRRNKHLMPQQIKKHLIFAKNIASNKYHIIVSHAIKTSAHNAQFMVNNI
jgi:hypothetical protein